MTDQKSRHLTQLSLVFLKPITSDNYRELKRIEKVGNAAATDLCNIPNYQEQFDSIYDQLKEDTKEILGDHKALKFNSDPRGYFLKIEDDFLRKTDFHFSQTDWGGYGIIVPEEIK